MPMLVLSRKAGESILIGDDVTIDIVSVDGDRVCVGINAPKSIRVYRKELLQQTIEINKSAIYAPSLSFDGIRAK
jgi:carbon storage regulator